ncbi:MAG: hypothetical protein DRJ11_11915 [Candidatus Aminicenantes bacterium]|nr:MAG: hypothetical protein DRJ11_11915 [Candidatus Aminicenantes bacterium]
MLWTFMKLAWRNLLRNKRRSIIAGTAIGLGLASLMFVDGMIIGMFNNMIEAATATFLGDGQIHRVGFRRTQEVELTINNAASLIQQLEKDPEVDKLALRVLSFGMITSAANLSAVTVVGIDPQREQFLSQVDEAIVAGSYLQNKSPQEIIIGRDLAETLEVGLNDRVVVTVAQAKTGDLSQEMFRVSGIFHFNIKEMDQGLVFISLAKAQQMLALPGEIHEIALKLSDRRLGQNKEHPFWKKYSREGNEALGWAALMPELSFALQFTDFSIFFMALLLVGVVAFSIINTLFMSLYERIFEFGVLRAVGTRKSGLFQLILLEAASLGIISIIIGSCLGLVLLLIFSHVGIDYSGIEFAGVTIQKAIYPVLHIGQFIRYPLWILIFTIVIGLYPALHAAKITPAEAMRKSL